MNGILTDLYYWHISPWERRPTRTTESREIDRKSEYKKRYFNQKMSLDDYPRFQE